MFFAIVVSYVLCCLFETSFTFVSHHFAFLVVESLCWMSFIWNWHVVLVHYVWTWHRMPLNGGELESSFHVSLTFSAEYIAIISYVLMERVLFLDKIYGLLHFSLELREIFMFINYTSRKGLNFSLLDRCKGLFFHICIMMLTLFHVFLIHLFIIHGLG